MNPNNSLYKQFKVVKYNDKANLCYKENKSYCAYATTLPIWISDKGFLNIWLPNKMSSKFLSPLKYYTSNPTIQCLVLWNPLWFYSIKHSKPDRKSFLYPFPVLLVHHSNKWISAIINISVHQFLSNQFSQAIHHSSIYIFLTCTWFILSCTYYSCMERRNISDISSQPEKYKTKRNEQASWS